MARANFALGHMEGEHCTKRAQAIVLRPTLIVQIVSTLIAAPSHAIAAPVISSPSLGQILRQISRIIFFIIVRRFHA